MKRLIGTLFVMAIFAAPAWAGKTATTSSPPEAAALPAFSQIDNAVILIEDLDTWMQTHRSRTELRQMNRAMGNACERFKSMETMTGALASDKDFQKEKGHADELKRLQASLTLLGTELTGWHQELKAMAELPPATTAAAEADRQRCESARKEISNRIAALSARASQLETEVATNQARSELGETAFSMGAALEQLASIAQSLDRLNKDPALDAQCLSHVSLAQERLLAMLQQIDTCQACVTTLAAKS